MCRFMTQMKIVEVDEGTVSWTGFTSWVPYPRLEAIVTIEVGSTSQLLVATAPPNGREISLVDLLEQLEETPQSP